jgi:TrpR-related protein YerC/YecD
MDWNGSQNKALVQAVLALKTVDEARRFLRDLMTEGEITEFSKRLKAAEMLSANIPYSKIESATGLSSTTVARVSKWLNGSEGGYRTIIARTHHHSPALAREG